MGDTWRCVKPFRRRRALPMSRNGVSLSLEARHALTLNQRTLGELLGLSRRTIQRWDSAQAEPSPWDLERIAIAVHPRDPELAARLAAEAGTTLVKLGLVAPIQQPPSVVTSAPPPAPPPHLTDVVVCAAAEELNVAPQAVRPVLLAAFRRAREVGLRVEDVERTLSAALERAPKTKIPKAPTP